MFGSNPFLKGLAMMVVGLLLLWQASDAHNRNLRLDANPHARATVEKTWVSSGKSASRYADLSFPGPIGIGLCHAKGVRLGASSVAAREKQVIEIVPSPGSCNAPDAPTARENGWLLAIEFVFAFGIFLAGTATLFGVTPVGMARPRFG